MVSSLGFNNNTYKPNIGVVVTNLCVFDFNGNKNSLRLLSIHPGVSLDEIEENTGFEFEIFSESISEIPTKTELKLIRNILDPSGIRENIFGAKK